MRNKKSESQFYENSQNCEVKKKSELREKSKFRIVKYKLAAAKKCQNRNSKKKSELREKTRKNFLLPNFWLINYFPAWHNYKNVYSVLQCPWS